jgi:dTDP-4-dehydrorhamnose reductase
MNIIVIGASGLVGSAIYKSLIDQNEVVGTYNKYKIENLKKLDLTDSIKTANFFKSRDWDIIVCCSALTNVDYCEKHPNESYLNNVVAIENLLNSQQNSKAKIIYISTDYVFNGKNGPYSERDLTDPISIYGKHKLIAENIIMGHSKNNVVIRVTNVFGPEYRNKNFLNRLLFLNNSEKLLVSSDQYATPIYSFDIGKLVRLIISSGGCGLYHLGGYEYITRQDIIDLVNYYPKKNILYETYTTLNSAQAANRPLLGGLRNLRIKEDFPNFKFKSIQMYLKEILLNE